MVTSETDMLADGDAAAASSLATSPSELLSPQLRMSQMLAYANHQSPNQAQQSLLSSLSVVSRDVHAMTEERPSEDSLRSKVHWQHDRDDPTTKTSLSSNSTMTTTTTKNAAVASTAPTMMMTTSSHHLYFGDVTLPQPQQLEQQHDTNALNTPAPSFVSPLSMTTNMPCTMSSTSMDDDQPPSPIDETAQAVEQDMRQSYSGHAVDYVYRMLLGKSTTGLPPTKRRRGANDHVSAA
jgi:hypothetical protein